MLGPSDSLDLAALAEAYRSRSLSPTGLVSGVLDRIARRGDDKVWIHLPPARRALVDGGLPRASWSGDQASLWSSVRDQGQYRSCRQPHDRGLSRLRLHAWQVGDSRAALGRGRRDSDRQDQPRPVRHRTERHTLALRGAEQRPQRRSHIRRVEFRLGGRSRRGSGELLSRHRHGRFRPCAGAIQQSRGDEADKRVVEHERGRSRLPFA